MADERFYGRNMAAPRPMPITGEFIKVAPPPEEACNCKRPPSRNGREFGKGTIWACAKCGKAWEFTGVSHGDQREPGSWDQWRRSQQHDIAQIRSAFGKFKPGDKTYE